MRQAYKMLRERIGHTKDLSEAQVSDVAFALRKLVEMEPGEDLPDGKIGTIEDLKNQADKAEESHDPKTVNQLSDALRTFLDEELREEVEAKEEEKTEQEEAGMEVENKTTCEACGHQQENMATTGAAPGPLGETEEERDLEEMAEEHGEKHPLAAEEAEDNSFADEDDSIEEADDELTDEERQQLEAMLASDEEEDIEECGDDEDMEESEDEEENGMKLGESNRSSLDDAERMELAVLREANRRRVRMQKASKAIAEAGAMIPAKELVTFRESQWPTVLNRLVGASSGSNPQRDYGSFMESDAPSKGVSQARDAFERSFARRSH